MCPRSEEACNGGEDIHPGREENRDENVQAETKLEEPYDDAEPHCPGSVVPLESR